MKAQNVPPQLRGFNKVFNALAQRWDYYTIWDDFLTLALCAFARETQEPLYFQTIKKYDKKELDLFCQLLGEWILYYTSENNQYTDALGDFYEILRSDYKAQKLGQFFTPLAVSQLVAQMTLTGMEKQGDKINDPCCGSGRFFLSCEGLKPKHFYFIGQDIDFTCVKMSCLNLMINGCKGAIYHMDSLSQELWSGWVVNSANSYHQYSILKIPDKPVIDEPPKIMEATPEDFSYLF